MLAGLRTNPTIANLPLHEVPTTWRVQGPEAFMWREGADFALYPFAVLSF
jgi:hypothetical protein